jgi:hypothetical protein
MERSMRFIKFSHLIYNSRNYFLLHSHLNGDSGSTVVKVLCYKSKVAGSIPDGVIGIFPWHNPSDRTMALRSTPPLAEMSTRSISWG